MPPLSWRDVRAADMPNMRAFLANSAVGLLPVPASSDLDVARTYVTLGAGQSAIGLSDMPQPRPSDGKYVLNLEPLRQANDRAHTGARLGLLGTRLRQLGLTTAVISPRSKAGAPFAALADANGGIDGVWIGGDYRNREALGRALAEALSQHAVVLLDASGADSLSEADLIVGDSLDLWPMDSALIAVMCPVSPAPASPEHRSLGWIALHWPLQEDAPGLLTSSSTRWPGLVSVADIAPAILGWWDDRGVGETGMGGRVIEVTVAPDALSRLDALDRMLSERYRLRFTAVKWYLAYGGVVLALGLALAMWCARGLKHMGALALGAALAPIGFLLAPVVGLERSALHLLIAAAITAALALLGARARRPAAGLATAMLLGLALIVLDVVLGSPLMRRSTMGFGVMFGSRFYGIGNEYMGYLGAMAVIGLGALLQSVRGARWLAALLGAAAVLVIGAPWWGANWGGAFAAAAGLVTLWLLHARKGWPMSVLVAVIALTASALIPVGLDLLNPAGERTHIGASAADLIAGDVGMLTGALQRKAAINWGLLVSYRFLLVAGLVMFAAVLWRMLRRGGPARQSLASQPVLAAGFVGALVMALVAMLVNDSGVIAGAAVLGVMASTSIFVAARAAEVPA